MASGAWGIDTGACIVVADGQGGWRLQSVPLDSSTQTNWDTIASQAVAAVQNNRDYLAIGTPTVAQVAAQVAALTRQNNKIIRVLFRVLDGTD